MTSKDGEDLALGVFRESRLVEKSSGANRETHLGVDFHLKRIAGENPRGPVTGCGRC